MGTVTAFRGRRPALGAARGEMTKLPATSPRGAIGAALFLLVSLFLLAAGADAPATQPGAAAEEIGAFVLDPSVARVAG